MSSIKINNLSSVGSQLLLDNESYLSELTSEEVNMTSGGGFSFVVGILGLSFAAYQASYQYGKDSREKQLRQGNACYI